MAWNPGPRAAFTKLVALSSAHPDLLAPALTNKPQLLHQLINSLTRRLDAFCPLHNLQWLAKETVAGWRSRNHDYVYRWAVQRHW